jgi:hypothetical protein
VLVVLLLTALLLLPGSYSQVARRWMADGRRVASVAVPPLWFVGLHETIAGGVIDGLPRSAPPRFFAAAERDATTLYRGLRPQFLQLGAIAMVGSAAVLLLAVAACWWNHRRLPSDTVPDSGRASRLTRMLKVPSRAIIRSSAGQAGFFFTIQTLTRSPSHRVTLAASVAVGFAIAFITLDALELPRMVTPASAPLSLLALQTLIVAVLLTGYRHLVRVPADPRAGWTIQLAWSGHGQQYANGSKRAAAVLLVVPALLVVCLIDVLTMGVRVAIARAVFGALVALLVTGILFLTYRKVPFATAYAGVGDLKAIGPLYSLALLLATLLLAAFERGALGTITSELALASGLIALLVAVQLAKRTQRLVPALDEFEEMPSNATQRFELTR